MSFGGFFLVANAKSWARISPVDQAAIKSISGEAFVRRATKIFNLEVNQSERELLEAGLIDVETVPEFGEELRSAVRFLDAEWIEKAEYAGVDARAALEYFRNEVLLESDRLRRLESIDTEDAGQ